MPEPSAALLVEITARTLAVGLSALVVAVVVGVPVGIWLGSRLFPGRAALIASASGTATSKNLPTGTSCFGTRFESVFPDTR